MLSQQLIDLHSQNRNWEHRQVFFQTATAVVADESIPIDRVSDAGEPFVQFLSNGMIYIWPAPSNSALSKT